MSRSGYTEDCENLNLYRGTVARALNGKRGQAFLREMGAALDAMPVKELIAYEIEEAGQVCAIGSVALSRRMPTDNIDASSPEDVADAFGIARSMAAEIAYENDDNGRAQETPAERWGRMRRWVDDQIVRAT